MARTIKLNSGYDMPTIGLGTWQAAPGEVERAVADGLDAGYRHIDCAMLYGNEREIGTALKAKMEEGVVRREELFITSKLWNTFHRPEVVEATCRRSLEALQLEYLDLYLVHWPVAFKEGEEPWPRDAAGRVQTTFVEPAATWRAMERLPALGLARSVGVSNFNSQQLARLCDAAQLPPAVNQVQSGMAAIPKSTNPTRLRENLAIYDFELAPTELQFMDSFNCGVRAYPLLELQHDVNYPFHIE